jgi:hypothetical protein
MTKTLRHLGVAAGAIAFAIGTAGAERPARGDAPPGRYTDNHDGTITDNETQLTWQQREVSGGFNETQAQTACPSGWRLPNVRELVTLIDYAKPVHQSAKLDPAFQGQTMGAAPSCCTWTSTPVAGHFFYVDFDWGTPWYNQPASGVRCVKP